MAQHISAAPAFAESEPINIAIIGAGLTGLTLALSISALPPNKRSHLRYTIYESYHRYSEIGAGIGFGASGHRIMKLLHPELWDRYKAIANWGDDDVWWDFVVGDRVGSSKGKDANGGQWEGKRIAQVRMKEGREGQSTAHRRSLMDILIQLLPSDCDVRFGKRLIGIISSTDSKPSESKVILQFQDGSTSSADLVIGADGVKSICRDIVFAPTNHAEALKARFTGKVAYRGLIPMVEAKKSIGEKAGQRMFYLGHGGHVVSFPVEGGKSMNVVAFANREEGVWEGSWVREGVEKELEGDYLDGRWGKDVEGIMRVSCLRFGFLIMLVLNGFCYFLLDLLLLSGTIFTNHIISSLRIPLTGQLSITLQHPLSTIHLFQFSFWVILLIPLLLILGRELALEVCS